MIDTRDVAAAGHGNDFFGRSSSSPPFLLPPLPSSLLFLPSFSILLEGPYPLPFSSYHSLSSPFSPTSSPLPSLSFRIRPLKLS